jgi:uncharacterized protein YbaR (Trm112 family)
MIEQELLDILACPVCDSRPPLRQEQGYLICTLKGHGYPVVDDIPHLLPENVIEPDEMKRLVHGS